MKDDNTPDDNILQFPTTPIDRDVFTEHLEDSEVDECINLLVEDLEDIQQALLAILEHPDGVSDKGRLEVLVHNLSDIIDGYVCT